ncbi:M4 family metallopeptidase [Bacillus sp. JJ1127]|uniref:M4 family metallopeptidase n=1 Tax=Bacillus sp. JJ1127 TaxID=3122952 RepID=UPI002FFF71DA
MNYKKIASAFFTFGLLCPLSTEVIHAQEVDKKEVKVDIAQPGLTIGKLTEPQNDTKENIAKKYLKGEVNGAKAQQDQVTTDKNVDFQPTNKETKENQTEIRLAQTYKNYKVYGQDLIVKVDKNGVITTVSGKVAQNLEQHPNLTITNFLSKNEVKSILRNVLQIPDDAVEKEFSSETFVYTKKDGNYTFTEVMTFTYENDAQIINGHAIIDLKNSDVLFQEKFIKNKENKSINQVTAPRLTPAKEQGTGINALQENVSFHIAKGTDGEFYLVDLSRGNGIYIYNANYADAMDGTSQAGYPGTLVSSNTANFTDKEAAGVMKNMSDIYDYFKKEHNLKSYDNKDSKIVASVHGFDSADVKGGVKENYVNAFWHPAWNQMVFGDGLNGKLTSALDVTAHEFGHAIFSGTTKNKVVRYPNLETDALNEGLADFWGTQIEIYVKKDKGNWIMGDSLDEVTRDIPNEIGDHGRKLYTNLQDFYNDGNNQEPHVNSGIISHVLYQLAEGKTYNGVSVQKQGNNKVSKVVMRALQNYATSAEDFESLQSHIVQAAKDLYGNTTSAEFEKAFQAHGYKPLTNINKVVEVQKGN